MPWLSELPTAQMRLSALSSANQSATIDLRLASNSLSLKASTASKSSLHSRDRP